MEGANQTLMAATNSDAGDGAKSLGMMEMEKGRHILPFKGTTWKLYILFLFMFPLASA